MKMADISNLDMNDAKPGFFKNQSKRKFIPKSRKNVEERSFSRSKFDSAQALISNNTPSTKDQHVFIKKNDLRENSRNHRSSLNYKHHSGRSNDYGLTVSKKSEKSNNFFTSKSATLHKQISQLKIDLEKKKLANQKLREDLENLEKSKNLNHNGSLLLEKDKLRHDIGKLTRELVGKNEKLRKLGANYKTLVEENNELDEKIRKLEEKEHRYDKTINEHFRVMEEYELLRNMVDENEFLKHEEIFLTKMKLEENSQKQMEFQIKELGDKMAVSKKLAKEYLRKYVDRLEAELAQLT